MKRKLYIINNGLKDYRGHYYESGIAIAEAARDLGLLPILGVHATCPPDLAPTWVDTHCVFRTDHWMTAPTECTNEAKELGKEAPPSKQPHPVIAAGKTLVRNLLPSLAQRFLQRLTRSESSQAADTGLSSCLLGPLTREQMLQGYLTQAGRPEEYDYTRCFQADLANLLAATEGRPEDLVFLPTAHGRELLAIHRLVFDLGPDRCPSFHLQFRHDMELQAPASDPGPEYGYRTLHRIFFYFAGMMPDHQRIFLSSDTAGLSQDLHHFSRRNFGVLPIPFRSRLIGPRRRQDSTLCLGFFGDVREEKGFHWLPEVVKCMESHRGRVSFLIQGSYANPAWEVKCRRALAELRQYPTNYVRLIGVDGPMSDEEYYRRFAEMDIMLCPYDAYAYRFRSSGVMAEALAAEIPTIVPSRTWLAGQQPQGAGVTFEDLPSFGAGVRDLCDNYARYQARAARFAATWLATHSPHNLVRALLARHQPATLVARTRAEKLENCIALEK